MSSSKIYLDSCIVIYLLEGNAQLQSLAKQKLKGLCKQNYEIWLSELSRFKFKQLEPGIQVEILTTI